MGQKKIRKAFIYQRDSSDCGPACLLSILRYYGGEDSLQHLREISGTTLSGTTLLGLSRAANQVGFQTKGVEVQNIQDIPSVNIPCIMVNRTERNSLHYVAFYGCRDGNVIISDPARGIYSLHIDELETIWTHACLLLSPSPQLTSKKIKNAEKHQWFRSLLIKDKSLILTSVFLGVLIAGINIMMSVFSQIFIDRIAPSRNTSILILGTSILLFFLLTQVFLSAVRSKILINQGFRFNVRTVRSFLRKILWLPKSFFDVHSTGDMVARLNDSKRIQNVISSLIGEITITLCMGMVSIIIVFLYSWQIGLICVLCAPLFFLIISSYNSKIRYQQRNVMATYADSESNFINTISGISDIINYSKQHSFLMKNIDCFSIYQKQNYSLGETKIKINILSGLSSVLIQMIVISIGAYYVFNHSISVGSFIAIIGISGTLFSSIANLAFSLISINEAKVAFDRMYEVMESNEFEINTNQEKISEVANIINKSGNCYLDIDKVSFRFIGKPLLLKGISAHIEQGKINSIVGPSGAGKSTICQLLNRYYQPSSGRILLSDKNIDDIPIENWRDNIILITQHPFIFSGTVLDNLCMDSPKDIDAIISFINQHELEELFSSFSEGLYTYIEENGKNISSGQKQIIAFVRAILRPREAIILDEATDCLDYSSERLVFRHLESIKDNTIIVFVTHRLDAVRQFSENAIVVENGLVSALGTHDMMMASDNFYSNFWRQFD